MSNQDEISKIVQAELEKLRQQVSDLETLTAEQSGIIDKLRDRESLLNTVFNTTPEAVSITRVTDGLYIDINDGFTDVTGFEREEVIGRSVTDLDIWDDISERAKVVKKIQEQGFVTNTEAKFKLKNGAIINGLISARLITFKLEPHIVAVTKNITRWKQTEQELLRRNQKLELLNSIIAAAAANPEPTSVLETACRELGLVFDLPSVTATIFNKDKTSAAVVAEYRLGDQTSQLNQVIAIQDDPTAKYLLQTKVPLIISEVKQEPRVKEIHAWLEERQLGSILIAPLLINGDIVGTLRLFSSKPRHFSPEKVSLAWSVTDQIANALSKIWLNEERHLLSTAINQAADIVIITDEQGIIRYVNPTFEQITNYKRTEVVGKASFLMARNNKDYRLHHKICMTLRAGEVWHGHITSTKKDNSPYTVEATITPIKDEMGNIVNYVSTQRDVTRALQLETQYQQAQKMEAIGQLTAGIAHDFNNLLMAINGFAELMQFKLPADSPFQDMAQRIVSSGESAANLIRQLLIFSRKQILEPKVLNLNNVINEIEKLLSRLIDEDIELTLNLAPNLWPIKIDPTQFEQIIINLAVNARDAMPTGGKLTIETKNVILTSDEIQQNDILKPGKHVMLSVRDTGRGISPDTLNHIFEPFFTTKNKGQGTGLGLSTVHGIIRQSKGNIQVFSKIDQGTEFVIYLPQVLEEAADNVIHPETESFAFGTETVLLVEDSAAVQEMVSLTLEAQGYKILRANNGEEALHIFNDYVEEIHLLLTDVVMPYMSGKELADKISQIKPNIKIIFTSGYTNDAISHYGVIEPGIIFLQKPFSPGALISKVREVLDTP